LVTKLLDDKEELLMKKKNEQSKTKNKLTYEELLFINDLLKFSDKIMAMINNDTEVELASEGSFNIFKNIVINNCEQYPNINFNKILDIFNTYQDAKKKLLETVHKVHDLIP
jgi:hypothetical protein